MSTQFANDYQLLQSPTADNVGMGYGTYRYYLGSSFLTFSMSTFNDTALTASNKAFAIQFIVQSVLSSIIDDVSSSISSSVLAGATIPAGTILFGNFSAVGLASGAAVIFLV